jgi:hypothetical protein
MELYWKDEYMGMEFMEAYTPLSSREKNTFEIAI